MKHLRRFNESQLITPNDLMMHKIIKEQVDRHGNHVDLNHIDVSNIGNMALLFKLIPKFKGDISRWNVENVTNMFSMFEDCKFDGDISLWNVKNVENTMRMFHGSKFSGDLNGWKPKSLKSFGKIFKKSPLEGREPIWYHCLYGGLFKSGEDYCNSLRYDWFRGKTIFIGRLETAVELFEGNLNGVFLIKNLRDFNIQD